MARLPRRRACVSVASRIAPRPRRSVANVCTHSSREGDPSRRQRSIDGRGVARRSGPRAGRHGERRAERPAELVAGGVTVGDGGVDQLDRPGREPGGGTRDPGQERHVDGRRLPLEVVGRRPVGRARQVLGDEQGDRRGERNGGRRVGTVARPTEGIDRGADVTGDETGDADRHEVVGRAR